jgi:transposase
MAVFAEGLPALADGVLVFLPLGGQMAPWTACMTRCVTRSVMPPVVTRWPGAGIIDSQAVKSSDTVGNPNRGYDAGKRSNGRKRHVVTDTLGLLLIVMVTAASVQDRDGGKVVLERLRFRMPSVAHIWADGGYAGKLIAYARKVLDLVVEAKKPGQRTFEVLPGRWVVERTLAWIMRCRRLVRDYERLPAHSETMVTWAMIGIMTRRLAPTPGQRPWQPATPNNILKHVLKDPASGRRQPQT